MNNPKEKKWFKRFLEEINQEKNGEPSFWPVQLLDVTPLDFFSCWNEMVNVYSRKYYSINELQG